MGWSARKNRTGIEYGGIASEYYWGNKNPTGKTKEYCLANCTTYAYGRMLEAGCKAPVTYVPSAYLWHTAVNTTDGWSVIDYDASKVEVGDILEWTGGNDVAVVEEITDGVIYLSGSFFTDRDTNLSFAEISQYMIDNYEWRLFHYHNLSWYYTALHNNNPVYILKNPNSSPEPGPTPPPTPTYDDVNIAIYATINKRRNKRNVKIIL